MTRRDGDHGNPTEDEVEHDFSMPADADLRPVDEDGHVEQDGEDEP